VVDRLSIQRANKKLPALAILCLVTLCVLVAAFVGMQPGADQFKLILLGGFFMTCTVGVVSGVVIDVIHPGVRSTGSAVLSLFQNLFGLAVGPFLVGALSDQWGLQVALALVPLFSILAAVFFLKAARSYDADVASVADIHLELDAHVTVAAAVAKA
jgi:MFS transporter, Spinster family, sphingosine-1-phosphate transporter